MTHSRRSRVLLDVGHRRPPPATAGHRRPPSATVGRRRPLVLPMQTRTVALSLVAIAMGKLVAFTCDSVRHMYVPLLLPALLIALYVSAFIIPTVKCVTTGWHVSGLLRHGTFFEIGVLAACACCAWLLQVAYGLRGAVYSQSRSTDSGSAMAAVRGGVLLLTLHLILAPLLVGTAITVCSSPTIHNAVALPMFAAAASLGLVQATRTDDYDSPVGTTACMAAGCAGCGALSALVYYVGDCACSPLLGGAEVMILTACALAYSDFLIAEERGKNEPRRGHGVSAAG